MVGKLPRTPLCVNWISSKEENQFMYKFGLNNYQESIFKYYLSPDSILQWNHNMYHEITLLLDIQFENPVRKCTAGGAKSLKRRDSAILKQNKQETWNQLSWVCAVASPVVSNISITYLNSPFLLRKERLVTFATQFWVFTKC